MQDAKEEKLKKFVEDNKRLKKEKKPLLKPEPPKIKEYEKR